MATAYYRGAGWKLEITRDVMQSVSQYETSDVRWRATDSNGHEHYYDRGYPTLDYIIDASHWCNGHEGIYNHDPHEAVDESHYECLICREVVKPGTNPPGWVALIPGLWHATLSGRRSDGWHASVSLTDAESEELRAAGDDADAVAQRLLDRSERIIGLRSAAF